SVKTDFREHEAKQISEKHINRELAALELERITILANLVAVENGGENFGFERVEVSVSDDRARQVFGIRRELLCELNGPLVRARLAHLAQTQARPSHVVVGDLLMRIRARDPLRQVAQEVTPFAFHLCVLAFGNNSILIRKLSDTHWP